MLLNASLGFISVVQNDIIKAVTIASVVFVPPTLIATIYGMNFHNPPAAELAWDGGYSWAICLELVSAAVPIFFCRYMRWI